MSEIADRYDPTRVEPHWYAVWEERGYFHADAASPKKPYCIVIPPPNVTGSLHLGHALNNTLQDILIRWQADARLQRALDARHRPRRHRHPDRGRAPARARRARPAATSAARPSSSGSGQWKDEYGRTIIRQLKRLGRLLRLGARALHARRGPLARRCARPSSASTKRGSSTAATTWSTGARAARPRSPTSRSSARTQGTLTTSSTRRGYGPARPSPPRGRRPCSATPRWPCIRRTSATRSTWARPLEAALVEREHHARWSRTARSIPSSAPGSSRSPPAHDANDFEIGRRHDLPVIAA